MYHYLEIYLFIDIKKEIHNGRMFSLHTNCYHGFYPHCLRGTYFFPLKFDGGVLTQGGTSNISVIKTLKVQFFQRNRVTLATSLLLNQSFCVKDDRSPSRLPRFVVATMDAWFQSNSFVFHFMCLGVKYLVSNLTVASASWILWIVLEFY